MRSSFFGLNVAQQGLFTSRTALDITNHNISNAETKGYSRQYGVQSALRPLQYARRGMVGTGSEITSVGQHRNQYLDYKYWGFAKDLGKYTVKSEALSQMELIFNEPSEVGFTSYFDSVFTTMQTLSKNPSDSASKSNTLNSLVSFTEYMNDISKQLRTMQGEANFGVKNSVEQINFIATQISTMNQQIGNLELQGNRANDLRDERSLLIDDLSKIVNVEVNYTADANGLETLGLTINGQQLVFGSALSLLEVRPREDALNPEDGVDMYDIYWQSGKKLYVNNPNLSGELKGYLDVRDGNNGDQFRGDIIAVDNTDPLNPTIQVSNLNRHDIKGSGQIFVDGTYLDYTSFSYDDVSGVMTFQLDPATPAAATATKVSIGDANSFKGIPYYMQQLNEFVRTIAREFNTVHEKGDSNTGLPLFVYKGYTGGLDTNLVSTYDALTVDDIVINPDILNDNSLLKTKFSAADGESQNDLIMEMIELRKDTQMFDKGVPDNFMQAIISEMGIDAKQMKSFKKGQEQLSSQVTNQRLSISDVDLDEEAINLVKFQQAYNMSAKIITVFDELYDVTINQMGAR